MEFFTKAVDFLSMGVMAVGAFIVIIGIIEFAEGQGDSNPAMKNTGGKKIMGGGIIVAAGMVLVPQLGSMIHM